jgi:branched-chain amino acid transport system substrate-binding protein
VVSIRHLTDGLGGRLGPFHPESCLPDGGSVADRTDIYPSSAIVRPSGDIEECDGAAGRRLLGSDDRLARYARAIFGSDVEQTRFLWHLANGGWIKVEIRNAVGGGGPGALVTILRESLPAALTERELDVLTLLAGGLHNREIGERLGASTRTVSTHVEHILMKLARSNRAGAAAMAVDRGWLRMPIPGGGAGMAALSIGLLEQNVDPGVLPVTEAPTRVRRQRPFRIGSAIPLSGPASADGLEMRSGAALATEEINARGGIAGRSVEHVVADLDAFRVEGVHQALEELASADVDAITLGYVLTDDGEPLKVAIEYGSPLLHAITSEEQLSLVRQDPARYRRTFQVCPSEVHYGRGFARFVGELTASGAWTPPRRAVAIVSTPVEGGRMATPTTMEAIEREGWTVSAAEVVPELGADWNSIVRRLRDAEPSAVLIADFVPAELASFQRAFASIEIEALVYAVYTPSIPEYLALAGPSADGVVWSTVTGTYSDPLGSRFSGRFAQAFGRPPGRSHAGIAYDVVHLLAHAWAAVGNPRDFEAVAQHLRRGAYRGVNGAYFFDDDQSALAYPDMTLDPSLGQAHLVFQIQHGSHRVLGPPLYAEGSFERPSWWPQFAVA